MKSAIIILLAKLAFGANVSFEGVNTGTIFPDEVSSENGYDLTIDHKVVGLGKIDPEDGASVTINVEAYGEVSSTCYNRGKTAAPSQNPIAEGSGSQEGEVGTDDTNGEYVFEIGAASDCTC
eukprot:4838261-Ditylum_brightwellii.AAC.1